MLNMSTLSPNDQGKTFWELVYGSVNHQVGSSSNNLVAFLSYVPDHEYSSDRPVAAVLPRWSSQPDWGLGCSVASCSARWSRAPLPINLSVLPVWSIFRIKSYNVCLFHCLAGNSRIMRSIFQPFSTRCFFVLITKDNVRRTNTREKVVDDQEQCSWIGYWRRRKTISVMMN